MFLKKITINPNILCNHRVSYPGINLLLPNQIHLEQTDSNPL